MGTKFRPDPLLEAFGADLGRMVEACIYGGLHDYAHLGLLSLASWPREEWWDKEMERMRQNRPPLLGLVEFIEGDSLDWHAVDFPETDGTDLAHPAYWRGSDEATEAVTRRLQQVLDGEDDGAGCIGYEPLERLRRQLLEMVRRTA